MKFTRQHVLYQQYARIRVANFMARKVLIQFSVHIISALPSAKQVCTRGSGAVDVARRARTLCFCRFGGPQPAKVDPSLQKLRCGLNSSARPLPSQPREPLYPYMLYPYIVISLSPLSSKIHIVCRPLPRRGDASGIHQVPSELSLRSFRS